MSDFKRRRLDGARPENNTTSERRPQKPSKPPHTKSTSKPVAKPPPPPPEPESSDDDSEFGGFSEDEEDTKVVSLPKRAASNGHESSARSTSPDAESDPGSDEEDSESEPDPTPKFVSEAGSKTDEAISEADPKPEDAIKTFEDLGVREELCDACTNLGFTRATPIQREAIPLALAGRDIIGLAETGSGKTAAFVLPILQALLDKPQPLFALIMAPTRELAYQIAQQVDALGAIINVKSATLVGGMDMVPQAIALSKRPHIVVATPGRLLDHLTNTKGFSLKHLKYLVLDEADRLLDLDFGEILDNILKALPREGRHTYLFSATLNTKVEGLQRAALKNPVRVSISSHSHQVVATLLQRFILVPHKFKDLYLIHLLNDNIGHATILFTRTVNETQRIAILLRTLGFQALPLHGQLSQSNRLGALNKFKSKARDILVATDVAARGLDIPSVDLVINFDLPQDSDTYVHRVGRTARAGKSGKAVSFVTQYDTEIFQRIEHALGKKIDEEVISRDEAMVLAERVGEAQREAVKQMKNLHDLKKSGRGRGGGGGGGMTRGGGRGGRGGRGRGRDHMDRDEG
ncbi:ATP-dependent rRNA helicase RRP3 [Ophiobolus disseminans]|uniref:ATP-dependent rRNA helicase RRP3 n=1 Tax=Ophiobolus disseminans TaxID=1469910 RepID=A0A6A6ZFE1_9PLEO|nr:ATP-dependent rRNA helicase RRP3 [Ophiobolus disseminans]